MKPLLQKHEELEVHLTLKESLVPLSSLTFSFQYHILNSHKAWKFTYNLSKLYAYIIIHNFIPGIDITKTKRKNLIKHNAANVNFCSNNNQTFI